MDAAAFLPVLALTLALVGAGMLAMAIGVIFRRPCLRGSCGGVGTQCVCARPDTGDGCRPRAGGDPVAFERETLESRSVTKMSGNDSDDLVQPLS